LELYNYNEQQTAWKQDRIGKFTASEIFKLLKGGRKKDQYFGDGAMTYINQKAAELLTGLPVGGALEGMAAIEWGNAQEPAGIAEFELHYNINVLYYGKANPLFYEYSTFAGGSPDFMISDEVGGEIKCPYNSGIHVEHLQLNSADDLREYSDQKYWQCQANMLFTGAKIWYFISYDPRFPIPEHQLKVIEVVRDEGDMKELKDRIQAGEKVLRTIIEKLETPSDIIIKQPKLITV
jgi:hypothetical protein